jgi:hypothetical protein
MYDILDSNFFVLIYTSESNAVWDLWIRPGEVITFLHGRGRNFYCVHADYFLAQIPSIAYKTSNNVRRPVHNGIKYGN